MAMGFPKALSLLEDPNVWIADTAASCDSSPHLNGAVNVRKGNAGGVIFGDSKNNEAQTIFDLPGVITDENGNRIQEARIRNIKHAKSAKFNLFSLTKRQKDGWLLNGNSEMIWLTKGDMKIVFDIKIPTPEGLIFAMYHQRKEPAEVNALGQDKEEKKMKLSIQKAHQLLGHSNDRLREKHARPLDGN